MAADEHLPTRDLVVAGARIPPEAIAELCRRYGLSELWLFGSASRGAETPDSDVDLIYVLRPDAHLGWRIERLNEELEELFGRKIDLVAKRSVHPLVRDEVLDSAKVLYAA
jgi:predicted nucleotidyltransferase